MTKRDSLTYLAARRRLRPGGADGGAPFVRRRVRRQPPITLTGVLTKIEWTNPHTHIYLDVKDDRGAVVNWQLEGYPPVALHRIGWRRDVR